MEAFASPFTTILISLPVAYLIVKWFNAPTHRLKHIPTIGHCGFFLSFIDAWRFKTGRARDMIQEGYDRYYGSAFKVPTFFEWIVFISGPQLTDELRRAGDDHLFFVEFVNEALQLERTAMSAFGQNRPHIEVVRTALIRNVSTLLPGVIDELSAAFKDLVTAANKDWTSIEAFPSARKIICRATNRFFLGPTFSRNAEYMDLIDKASTDILKTLGYRTYFPGPFKTFASQHLTDLPSDIKNISAQLRPLIEAELQLEKDGSRSNNVIRWLLDEAKEVKPSVDDIVLRVLAINFVALETESDGLKQILFYLAAYPEYIQAMREEAESIIEAEGLTKDSLAKMHKVDSFIKETQRLTIMSLAVHRNVIKDFTISNGLFLPKGVKVAIPTHAVQTDERNYTDALEFKPFRFADMRQLDEQDGDSADSEKLRRGELASLSPTFLNFGMGRHACPGRFFAANMLKTVLVHILLNYDVALPDFPAASTQGTNLRIPEGLEHVRLRRRA